MRWFGTLECPWLGNAFSGHLSKPKPKIFPLAPNMVVLLGDTISSKQSARAKIRIAMVFLKFGNPELLMINLGAETFTEPQKTGAALTRPKRAGVTGAKTTNTTTNRKSTD